MRIGRQGELYFKKKERKVRIKRKGRPKQMIKEREEKGKRKSCIKDDMEKEGNEREKKKEANGIDRRNRRMEELKR